MSSLLIDSWRRDPKIWSCSSIISPFGKSSSVWRYKALIKASKLLLPVPIFPIVLDVLSTQLILHKVKSAFCTLSPIFFTNIWLLKPDWWFRFSCGRNMLEVIATSPPQKPWLAVAPGQVLDEAKGGQQWGSNFKLVRLGCTNIFSYFQFVVLLANSVDAWVKLYVCLALCKFKTQVNKLNLRSRIKEITFYQRLWKYWSSTSSVKVRPGSYSESHWSCSAAFLTACSPTASSSCLWCFCHSSSPIPIPYPCHRLGESPRGNKS